MVLWFCSSVVPLLNPALRSSLDAGRAVLYHVNDRGMPPTHRSADMLAGGRALHIARPAGLSHTSLYAEDVTCQTTASPLPVA